MMVHLCVICMVRLPPLMPLSIEHRRIIEAIVSPIINIAELQTCKLLVCYQCFPVLMSVQAFCKKALAGVTNLLMLHRHVNQLQVEAAIRTEPGGFLPNSTVANVVTETRNIEYTPAAIKDEPLDSMFTIKKEAVYDTEAKNSNSTGEPEVKHETQPGLQPESEATISWDFDHKGLEVLPAPTIRVRNLQHLTNTPTDARSDEQFKYNTHRRMEHNNGFCNSNHQSQKRQQKRHFNGTRAAAKKPKVVVKPTPVQCNICLKMVNDKYYLRRHLKRKHKECEECGPVCTSKCSKTIKYCVECDIEFPIPSLYRLHMQSKKHAKESDYKFECDICGKRFAQISVLRNHMDLHSDTQYPCQHCDQVFNTKSTRRHHMRRTHDKYKGKRRNFICDYCSKAFETKHLVLQHINSHTGARPYACKICGDTFGYTSALYRHGRFKHKIQKKPKEKCKQ